MHSTTELIEHINEVNRQAQDTGNCKEIRVISGDVKEMYTNLPHGQILTALNWLVETVQTVTDIPVGEMLAAIPSKKSWNKMTVLIRDGETVRGTGLITVPVVKIVQTVIFDLQNSYCTVGDRVNRQIKGIPMGSPLSPALAIITCMRAEKEFISSIATDSQYLRGSRWMDDLLITIIRTEENSKRMNEIEHRIKTIYPNMTLELEKQVDDSKFLESRIRLELDNRVNLTYYNKNKEAIQKNDELVFRTMMHRSSYVPERRFADLMVQALGRIVTACTNTDMILLAVHERVAELIKAGVSDRELDRTIFRLTLLPKASPFFSCVWAYLLQERHATRP